MARDRVARWAAVLVSGVLLWFVPLFGLTVAQRHLREMQKGDRVFFYHTGKEKAVIGTATVSKTAYPDPKDGNLVVVELTAGKALKRPVTLAEVKADKRFADMPLVRIARLSVQKVTDDQWGMIEEMSKR